MSQCARWEAGVEVEVTLTGRQPERVTCTAGSFQFDSPSEYVEFATVRVLSQSGATTPVQSTQDVHCARNLYVTQL